MRTYFGFLDEMLQNTIQGLMSFTTGTQDSLWRI